MTYSRGILAGMGSLKDKSQSGRAMRWGGAGPLRTILSWMDGHSEVLKVQLTVTEVRSPGLPRGCARWRLSRNPAEASRETQTSGWRAAPDLFSRDVAQIRPELDQRTICFLNRAVEPFNHRHGFLLAECFPQNVAQWLDIGVVFKRRPVRVVDQENVDSARPAVGKPLPAVVERPFGFSAASYMRAMALRKSSPLP